MGTVLPNRHYQFCQAHYLRNLAASPAEADTAFKSELRHTLYPHIGNLLRQEPRPKARLLGVPCTAPEAKADEVITQLLRHTRYLLALTGRPPFRLANFEIYAWLQNVVGFGLDLLAERYNLRRTQWYQDLRSALLLLRTHTYQEFRQGATWLCDIAYIFAPSRAP